MMMPILILAAAAIGDVQQTPALRLDPVVLPRRSDNEPMWLMGFAAFGADADLRRLEEAAAAANAAHNRIDDDQRGRLEVMVLFRDTTSADALRLYRDAIAGRYGRLEVEAVVTSVADARDGVDTEREVEIVDPAALRPE
jgi:hypothetical protein